MMPTQGLYGSVVEVRDGGDLCDFMSREYPKQNAIQATPANCESASILLKGIKESTLITCSFRDGMSANTMILGHLCPEQRSEAGQDDVQ